MIGIKWADTPQFLQHGGVDGLRLLVTRSAMDNAMGNRSNALRPGLIAEELEQQRSTRCVIWRIKRALLWLVCGVLPDCQFAVLESDTVELARHFTRRRITGAEQREFETRGTGVNGENQVLGSLVNFNDGIEQLQRVGFLALKRIAPDDRAETAAIADRGHFLQEILVRFGRSPRKDHDTPATESALDNVPHSLGQRANRYFLFLVNFARSLLFYLSGRQFNLDNVRAELRRQVRGVSADIDGGLTLFAQTGPTGVGPNHDSEAAALRQLTRLANLFVHFDAMGGAGINRKANRGAT